MAIITYRDIVPLRGSINPEQRKQIEAHYAQTNTRLAELANQAAQLMTQRRDTIDTALAIRNRLYPEHWFHGRRRPEPDAPALPPIQPNAIHLKGRALRQLCRDILRNQGPQTLIELHSTLHILGYAINATWPTKTLADAMRYEVTTGNAQRLKRGVYQVIDRNDRQPPPPHTGETNLHTQGGPPFIISVDDLVPGARSDRQAAKETRNDIVDRPGEHTDRTSQVRGQFGPFGNGQRQHRRQTPGIEPNMSGTLEAGTRTRASLADSYNLSARNCHLTRPEPGKAHKPRPCARHQRSSMHRDRRTDDRFANHGGPAVAQPLERSSHISRPERIVGGQQHVDPNHLAWHNEYSSPTAAPTNDVNRSADSLTDNRLRLCRPQRHTNRGRCVHPHRPAEVGLSRNTSMENRHRLGEPRHCPRPR
jgi:hypothetical protein